MIKLSTIAMRRKKIFIAGEHGLLGRALAEKLLGRKLPAGPAPRERKDLTVLENCLRLTKGADLVINAAGIISSRKDQIKRPGQIFYTNNLINLQLLEACRRNSIKNFIAFGSITAYPTVAKGKLKEEMLFSGLAPKINGNFGFYGLSSWLIPYAALSYSLECGIKSRIIVFPNLYGPGDKFYDPIPPLVANMIKDLSLARKEGRREFYGGNNKNHVMDLLYIEDAADFVSRVIKRPGKENFLCLNAGSGRAVTIGDVCAAAADAAGFKGKIVWENGLSVSRKVLDNALAKKLYNWKPKVNLKEGVKKTVAWYKKNYENTTKN